MRGYRKGVGIFLFNDQGLVWMGRRSEKWTAASHLYDSKHLWQMPQGGVDAGETILDAARRELFEETGITHVDVVKESAEWLNYDLPKNLIGKVLSGYRGQTQKWFAMRFLGNEGEINLQAHGTPEFIDWRWCAPEEMLDLVVPFKADLYRQVIREFQPHLPKRAR